MTLDASMADRILNPASEKLFINLGEAAQRIPQTERAAIRGVPWRQIIGLRNILAHGYERIDQETLHRTAAADLPAVEAALTAALAERDRSWRRASAGRLAPLGCGAGSSASPPAKRVRRARMQA